MMNYITLVVTFVGEIAILWGVVKVFYSWLSKVTNGQKCQLREAMLRMYYKNKDDEKIRQYEKEHFVYCYEAYKALKGNSFIDDIYKEVRTWEVVS